MGRAQILFSSLSPCPPLHVLLSHLASPGKEEEPFPLETSVKFFTHDARQNVFVSIAIVIKTTEERGGETTNKWKKNFVLAVKLSYGPLLTVDSLVSLYLKVSHCYMLSDGKGVI